jgi:hypothetical protein
MRLARTVGRVALGATSLLVLVGCGFMSVGERPIPSVAGAVAATAWQSMDPEMPFEFDDGRAFDTPERVLDRLAEIISTTRVPRVHVRTGVLSRAGSRATAYLQLTDATATSGDVVAYEVRLTLTEQAGTWTVTGLETREQCGVALRDARCSAGEGLGGS